MSARQFTDEYRRAERLLEKNQISFFLTVMNSGFLKNESELLHTTGW